MIGMKSLSRRARRAGNESGFTLIELVIVLVVLGVLAAFALPQFSSLQQDADEAGAASALASFANACYSQQAAQGQVGEATPTTPAPCDYAITTTTYCATLETNKATIFLAAGLVDASGAARTDLAIAAGAANGDASFSIPLAGSAVLTGTTSSPVAVCSVNAT